jgi:hypothetical protein
MKKHTRKVTRPMTENTMLLTSAGKNVAMGGRESKGLMGYLCWVAGEWGRRREGENVFMRL